jgi:8-oxo-dGTP diphosphatase
MPKPIVVTAAIMVKDARILAARRNSNCHLAGLWEFPGGKTEEGETPEDCLKRELDEEFGITTKIGSFFGESIYDYGPKTIHLLAYRVEHILGDFQLMAHDEIRWLSIDELDQVEWAPADIPLVELYKNGNFKEA